MCGRSCYEEKNWEANTRICFLLIAGGLENPNWCGGANRNMTANYDIDYCVFAAHCICQNLNSDRRTARHV